MANVARVLTIAGSDSGGCAGIQADLKTFGALGVHGMTAITSVTAQDSRRLHLTSDVALANVKKQIEAVIEDIGVEAVKTGMLSSSAIISLVAGKMRQFGVRQLVVDPVMVTTGGDSLLQEGAVETLKTELLPLARILTPNLREAEFLTQQTICNEAEVESAARSLFEMGPRSVLIKGGHFPNDRFSTDYFFEGRELIPFKAPRISTKNTHGSGCTFASAIAAFLALGWELRPAVHLAKEYVTEAIRHSFPLGQGNGPLGHFYRHWSVLVAEQDPERPINPTPL